MKKKFKIAVANIVRTIIIRLFIEHTPPHVKSSEKNLRVAKFMMAIDDLIP